MKKICKIVSVILVLITMSSMASVLATAAKKPTLIVDTVTADPGETIEIKVSISGNPGIAGALIKISYDSKLTLISAENGTAFSNLTYTKPGRLGNPVKFLWDSEKEVSKKDGTVLKLSFKVPDGIEKGTALSIKATCESGDAYDLNMDTVEINSVNGGINIAKEAENENSFFKRIIASIKNVFAVVIKFFKNIF